MQYILTIFGLVAGNFIYQFFNAEQWSVALDRSYFQAVAVGSVWFVNLVRP